VCYIDLRTCAYVCVFSDELTNLKQELRNIAHESKLIPLAVRMPCAAGLPVNLYSNSLTVGTDAEFAMSELLPRTPMLQSSHLKRNRFPTTFSFVAKFG
jgi:hypothetical protein